MSARDLPDDAGVERKAQALMDGIAARREQDLRELHRLFARRVHAFVLHRCSDPSIADTVVGDVFFEVWSKPEAFKRQSRLSTWLLGIARYKMLDELRKRRDDQDPIDDHADVLEDERPIAEAVLERAQDAQQLRRCIEGLSATHRECLHLVYFEELGVNDVARLQNVPSGTVKTRLFHARSHMRACLESGVARAGA